jgi:hypothetical protein
MPRTLSRMLGAALICAVLSIGVASAAEYSALTSMDTQAAKAANVAYPITMSGDASQAFKIDGSKIIIQQSGDFYFSAAAQVGAVPGVNVTGDIYLWVRLNGKDMEDSNSIQTIPQPNFTAVLVSQGGITLKKGDVLEFIYAATRPGLGLIATRPKNMPGVPSMIFTIFEL